MPIKRLLKEWSHLEPEKCSQVGEIYAIRGWLLTDENELNDRLNISEIQCAVQEAIESHGWHWFIGRVKIEEGIYYKSRIAIPPAEDQVRKAPKLNAFLSTHSSTHVLLQAYLQALTAMQSFASLTPAETDINLLPPENEFADSSEQTEERVKTREEVSLIE